MLASAFLLSACGHGNSNAPASMASAQSGRGTLMDNPPTKSGSFTTSDLLSVLGGSDIGKLFLKLAYSPTCSLDVYSLQYETVGGQNESTTDTAALMIPTGSDPSCQQPRPIVMYAHGTSTDKNYNIGDLMNNNEGALLAAVFAAQGFIVVAPNYAGYNGSSLAYHPYLNADQQSKDMMDALTAAKTALSAIKVSDNSKLYVTGYSQGGFVAMATHRALQAAGTPVTAAAPMSGPYALAAFGDAIFEGQVNMSATANFTLLITSYQHSYGNIYANPTDVFEAKYATGIDELLPSTTSLSDLVNQGRLPQNALFNSTPPAPQYASMTPATQPAKLAPVFANGFGTDNLVTNNYRQQYLQDAQANPDGGFPNTTSNTPAASPGNALRKALATNDLRNWSPTAPVLLCAGDSDPTVFYLNTQLMQGYWSAHAPGSQVTILDVDSSPSSGDPYADVKTEFSAAKAAVAAAGGDMAVLQDYHAGLVPPFCLHAVKSFFDTH